MQDIFLEATRLKLRFENAGGKLSVEDLWDLPLTSTKGNSLDRIAIGLNNAIREQEVSFVNPKNTKNSTDELKFEIVKSIIAFKQNENARLATERAKQEEKQKLLSLLSDKQNDELKALPIEEIQARLKALGT